jgi:8-oxo-dGTP pyrophosphatase MutT (NUDIX family)
MRTIQRDIVGAFIISSDGKLLMGKAGVYADQWVIPGGGINDGESTHDALIREVSEETGLDITHSTIEAVPLQLTGSSEKTLRDTGERVFVDMNFRDFVVRLEKPADMIELKTDDDFVDARWFPLGELTEVPMSPPMITTLQMLGYLPPNQT